MEIDKQNRDWKMEGGIKNQYRIKQLQDNRFVVERRVLRKGNRGLFSSKAEDYFDWETVYGSVNVIGTYIHADELIFCSLEAARKWIADQQKYPIYHKPE